MTRAAALLAFQSISALSMAAADSPIVVVRDVVRGIAERLGAVAAAYGLTDDSQAATACWCAEYWRRTDGRLSCRAGNQS